MVETQPVREAQAGGPQTGPLLITAIVLTFNEEANLAACLASLSSCVSRVIVVDSGSTDRTLEIAREFGATCLYHPFETHARQWKWALDQLPPECDWVLGLDADQVLTPGLQDEMRALSRTGTAGVIAGYYINRRQVFRGRWIRHGGYYPKYLLKLFRRSAVWLDERDLMDHHFYVRGQVAKLEGDLVEDNHKENDITFWLDKHNRYAVLHAREERVRRYDPQAWPIPGRLFGTPDERVVWLKQRWYRMPLYLRPVLYFFYRYVLRLGFLDGKEGFLFHFLQGFWYRLIVDVHLDAGPDRADAR